MSKRRGIKGSLEKDSPPFGFHKWGLDFQHEFSNQVETLVENVVREALKIATTEKYEVFATFLCDDDAAPPDDPTTITVCLPLGEDEDASPEWHFALSEMTADFIDRHTLPTTGTIDPDVRKPFESLRDSLRKLADQLDEAIKKSDL